MALAGGGVLTHSAGPRASEWDLAQDDKGDGEEVSWASS